ncbi:MAG TPA: sn-glycerol-3-phosphate ABC transporter ATP-binding protein UgpC [Longimicrobiaceae bacterium]|jgi:multiple sugar transport system ATP-binding protein|nr:sn-glycerol-3-phosphate ABC transporter ATP-binding protein UgpC [Longimicrobiaceae bacterium]
MARVKLEGIRKTYENGYTAVHGISLDVEPGEFVVLVGPSGCGKSTTLRMVAGLESISGGTLSIGGRVVNDVAPKDRDIAMVFQSYALYPHMTVRDNLAFALKLRKLPKPDIAERVKRAAGLLSIEPLLDRRPAELSGGQRQRVALGRALVREPQVFLFDEPLSNLDAKLRGQMRKEIAALHRRLGTTSIYVTHDQTEAMTMGDRIVVMNGGRVEQVGAPMDLYRNPANRFVAGFLGSPPMNFLAGRLVRADGPAFLSADAGFRLPLDASVSAVLGQADTRPVVLGIRPEDVRLAEGGSADAPRLGHVPLLLEAAEPMGNETIVYLRAGADEVVARVPPRSLPAPGQPVEAAFDLARLHFFHSETGASLTALG